MMVSAADSAAPAEEAVAEGATMRENRCLSLLATIVLISSKVI